MGGLLLLGETGVVCEQALASVGPRAIGASGGFHLDDTQVDAELNLLLSIAAKNPADFYLAGFVGPIAEQVVKVQTHCDSVSKREGVLSTEAKGGVSARSKSFLAVTIPLDGIFDQFLTKETGCCTESLQRLRQ